MNRLVLVLGLSLVSSAAYAGEKEAPQDPDWLRTVKLFAGKHKLEGTLTMGDKPPIKVKMAADCKKIAGGAAVACSISGKSAELGTFDDMHLIGWDKESEKMRMLSWTASGEVHDHVGLWKDEFTIQMKVEAKEKKRAYVEYVSFYVNDKGKLWSMKSTKTFSDDGSEVLLELKID